MTHSLDLSSDKPVSNRASPRTAVPLNSGSQNPQLP